MRIGRLKISSELLSDMLGFGVDAIHDVRMDFETSMVELKVASERFDDVPEGSEIPLYNPSYRQVDGVGVELAEVTRVEHAPRLYPARKLTPEEIEHIKEEWRKLSANRTMTIVPDVD